jgi:predicted nucleic acid-binding protein
MITAVDTNVLIDVLEPDPVHGRNSLDLLKRAMREGNVVACEVVWAEVATAYGERMEEVISSLVQAGIGFVPMNEPAAIKAAECWRAFRHQGGTGVRIAADFLIGGHALVQCDRLLTRDRGFYRDYFRPLVLLTSDPYLKQ